jgi:predicted nuclease of predicted toxin-antitoxin system
VSLLFDQNISFRIIKKIQDTFPNSKQIRELGLENYSDNGIWNYAKDNNQK